VTRHSTAKLKQSMQRWEQCGNLPARAWGKHSLYSSQAPRGKTLTDSFLSLVAHNKHQN